MIGRTAPADVGEVPPWKSRSDHTGRVLRQHRCWLTDLVVAAEAGEERGRGVDHAHGLGDDGRAAAEAGRPVPLPGGVALDAAGLLLADVELSLRDESRASLPAVGAVEADTPALQAREEPLQ